MMLLMSNCYAMKVLRERYKIQKACDKANLGIKLDYLRYTKHCGMIGVKYSTLTRRIRVMMESWLIKKQQLCLLGML